MRVFLALAAIGFASPAWSADAVASGDLQVTGQVGVGLAVPQARLEARLAAADAYGVKVSSPNGTTLMAVHPDGKVAVGSATPQALLDIRGTDASGDIGLLARVGNSSSTTSSSQLIFASTGAYGYAHAMRTRHAEGQNLGNAVDFFVWLDSAQPSAAGTWHALSLQAVPYASTASVHVNPFGTPDVELEVSDGATTGGGSILRAAAVTPSSRGFKRDIAYLDEAGLAAATADLKALRHARFRYKTQRPGAPLALGLIYEDAPESVRGAGRTVLLDARVANLEAALALAARRVKELEAKVADLEARRGGRR